jgi:hypothetical protein
VERARQRAAVSARPPDVNAPVKAPIERDFRLTFSSFSRAGSNGFGVVSLSRPFRGTRVSSFFSFRE